MNGRGARYGAAVAAGVALGMFLLSGCASPGPPQPPSLKLPEVVTDLTASRVGDEVRLRWTTPTRTTDKLLIAGPIVAEICRETPAPGTTAPAKAPQNMTASVRKNAVTAPCLPVVVRKLVTSGASEAVDVLPAELATGSARLLAYRMQLRNAAGHTAGASAAAYAASGPAPPTVEELRGRETKVGIVLEWKPEVGGAETIELDRTAMESSAGTPETAGSDAPRKSALPGAAKGPLESRFRVGAADSTVVDAGGTVDRTAQIGHEYRYTAQRVRRVELGGLTLELLSLPSAVVPVEMKDVFPPEAPLGLVAVPGFVSVANDSTQKPTIDLSWEPNMEPHIAGYRVYRHDLSSEAVSAWQQLDSELVPVAAYRDLSVVAGRRYAYRVTAVDATGKESERSDEVVETAAAP
jgi:hypothetical protein